MMHLIDMDSKHHAAIKKGMATIDRWIASRMAHLGDDAYFKGTVQDITAMCEQRIKLQKMLCIFSSVRVER